MTKLPFEPEGESVEITSDPTGPRLAEEAPSEETGTALVCIDPTIDPRVKKLHEEALALLQEAAVLVIVDGPSVKVATDSLVLLKGLGIALEGLRDSYVRPLNGYVKTINDTFKVFTDPVSQADGLTRQKVLAYHKEQDRLQAEQEELNRKKLELAQEEMRISGEMSQPMDLVEVQPSVPTRHLTGMGSAGTAKVWKFEVENFAKLPDVYKLPDMTMIRNKVIALKTEGEPIPGVRAWQEDTLKVSVNKG